MAGTARNNGCKRHAPVARRQPHRWMQEACAEAAPLAAPGSHNACQPRASWPVLVPRRRRSPAINNGCMRHALRPCRRHGSTCPPLRMQVACKGSSPAASPAVNNGCLRLALKSRRRHPLQATMDAGGRYWPKYFCGWRRRTISGRYCAKYFCGWRRRTIAGRYCASRYCAP